MTNIEIAKQAGKQYAQSFFKDMLDVNFQGENFEWKNFPSMFNGICAASLFATYSKTPKNLEELEKIAVQAMNEEGEKLKEQYQLNKTLPTKNKLQKV